MRLSKIGRLESCQWTLGILMVAAAGSLAAQNKKPAPAPAPAARPAPAPRPAAQPPRPAGGNAQGRGPAGPATRTNPYGTAPRTNPYGTAHTGPTTTNPGGGRPGPTANGPHAGNGGPTVTNPRGGNGPTANGPAAGRGVPPVNNGPGGRPGPNGNSAAGGRNVPPGNGPGHNGPGGTAPYNRGAGGPGNGPHDASRGFGGPRMNAGGGHSVNAGITGRPAPAGVRQTRLENGNAIQRRPDGRVSDVHDARRGVDIHHGLAGNRRVMVERADHSRIVAERGRPGYIQRPYEFHGHEYARRSFYDHGRVYDHYYRGYYYHGVYVEAYAPVRYYPAPFYGWVYNPWYQPVYYPWGWTGSPWYGYYGYYFSPYPSYPTAAAWLTDYLISTDLAAHYQAQQDAQSLPPADQPQGNGSPVMTPAVKQLIADEVKNQISLENAEAQQNAQNQEPDPSLTGVGRLLADNKTHVFVAGSTLDVVDADGAECAISDGDALEMEIPLDPDATAVNLKVLSSKGGKECKISSMVTLALTDVQDMQNHMRETVDQGLQELATKQGQGGLPAAPPSARASAVDVAFAKNAPPPDPRGAFDINQQLQQADQSEQEVVGQARLQDGSTDGGAVTAVATTATVTLGQSVDQVTAALGPPMTVIDLGNKKIYKYKDMKVTFNGGKVTDVQ